MLLFADGSLRTQTLFPPLPFNHPPCPKGCACSKFHVTEIPCLPKKNVPFQVVFSHSFEFVVTTLLLTPYSGYFELVTYNFVGKFLRLGNAVALPTFLQNGDCVSDRRIFTCNLQTNFHNQKFEILTSHPDNVFEITIGTQFP